MLWPIPADTHPERIGPMTGFDRSTLAGTAITRARGWNVSAACNARTEILPGAQPLTRVSMPNISPQPQSARIRTQNRCGSDVFDAQNFDFLLARRRAHPDHVALIRAQQRPRDRRDPAHMALARIDLVDAHDLDRAFLALGVGIADRGAEEHLVGLGPLGGIDDFGPLQPLAEEADAPVDLAQALLAVEIVAVLRAIAVGGGPRHDLHHLRPLLAHELAELLAQAGEALRGHVVLGAGGQARDLVREIVLVLAVAFLGEGLAHFGAYSINSMPMTTTPIRLQRASGESRVAFDLRDGRTRLAESYPRHSCPDFFPLP